MRQSTQDTSSGAGADTRTSQTEDSQRGIAYSHHSQNKRRDQALVPALETQEVSDTQTAKHQAGQRRPRQKNGTQKYRRQTRKRTQPHLKQFKNC